MSYHIGQRVRIIKVHNSENAHTIGTICRITHALTLTPFSDGTTMPAYGVDLQPTRKTLWDYVSLLPDQIEPVDDEDDTSTATEETFKAIS